MGSIGFIRGGFLAGLVLALTAGAETSRIEDCVAIQDQAARLACYDQLHGRDAPAASRSDPETTAVKPDDTVVTKAPAEPYQASPQELEHVEKPSPPGTEELGAEQLPKAPEAQAQQADEMVSAVRKMGEGITGRHWFRLDNGQLWEQVSPERTTIEAGDAIRVTRGLLGTYHLRREDGGSRSTSVRRRE